MLMSKIAPLDQDFTCEQSAYKFSTLLSLGIPQELDLYCNTGLAHIGAKLLIGTPKSYCSSDDII